MIISRTRGLFRCSTGSCFALVAYCLIAACEGAAQGGAGLENGAALQTAAPTDIPVLAAQRLTIEPALVNAKERNNLSGAACSAQGVCLMIGDEKRYARFFTLSGGLLAPANVIYLLPEEEGGVELDESDGEAIAFSNGAFYVIGSHSRSRSGAAQASRHFVFRYRFDGSAPPPADIGTAVAVSPEVERRTLDPIIQAHPLLNQHLTEPPGDTADGNSPSHGVNIEGLAVSGNDMFVGFRGPVDGAGAVILRLSLNGLFGTAPRLVQTHRVNLGAGQGIRDLAAVQGGLLILAGPERRNGVEPSPVFYLWRPDSDQLVPLGRLPREHGDDNPESVTILEETDDAYRMLVLWDGDAGGVPMIVSVPKPRR